MGREEIDEVMRKVKDWLTEEGIYRDKISDESTNYHFVVEFPPNSGHRGGVIQPKQRDDLIIIISVTALSKEHYEGLKSKPKKERDNILWDMRFQLLFRDSDFRMMPNAEDLQNIEFTRSLHFEGLTKNMLMDALRENYRCHLFIVWKMMQLFGEAPPTSPETMYG